MSAVPGLVALVVTLAAAVLAVYSAHIPVLRDLTGAAPLDGGDES